MKAALETLVEAAIRAPSGDNTQPWQFSLDVDSGTVRVYLDETRDPSPMNAGQRMARIAIGAAVENMLRTAQWNGWRAVLDANPGPALAAVHLEQVNESRCEIDPLVLARVTNRRRYDGRPLPDQTLEQLRAKTPSLAGVDTHWIVDRDRLDALAALISRADAAMFCEPSMRRAFLSKIDFRTARELPVQDGMPVASLELSRGNRLALRVMPAIPDWLLRTPPAANAFASAARKLVASSSGLCLIVAPDREERNDVLVGQAVECAWLALTACGLAAQPMMSLLILKNTRDNGSSETLASLGQSTAAAVFHDLHGLTGEIGSGRAAALLRFGFASPPTARTGRLAPQVRDARSPMTTPDPVPMR